MRLGGDQASAQRLLDIAAERHPLLAGALLGAIEDRVAEIDGVSSIKIPGVPVEPRAAAAHVARIRSLIPDDVTIGVSGDGFAAAGKAAGVDAWYSVLAGTLPDPAVELWRTGDDSALRELWQIVGEAGGLRVMAAIAEHLGHVGRDPLPRPLLGLSSGLRARLIRVFDALDVGE